MACASVFVLKAVMTAAIIVLSPGCGARAQPFHPGIERLVEEGAPVQGEGLPPGARPPRREQPVPASDIPFLEKYRDGGR